MHQEPQRTFPFSTGTFHICLTKTSGLYLTYLSSFVSFWRPTSPKIQFTNSIVCKRLLLLWTLPRHTHTHTRAHGKMNISRPCVLLRFWEYPTTHIYHLNKTSLVVGIDLYNKTGYLSLSLSLVLFLQSCKNVYTVLSGCVCVRSKKQAISSYL